MTLQLTEIEQELEIQERRNSVLGDLESLMRVQKEANRRQIRRLERAHSAVVNGGEVSSVDRPSWEVKTRNVALVAACMSVIAAYK